MMVLPTRFKFRNDEQINGVAVKRLIHEVALGLGVTVNGPHIAGPYSIMELDFDSEEDALYAALKLHDGLHQYIYPKRN
jgi:hypothetical protein